MFQFTSRLMAEAEARFTAVERISQYITSLPQEPPATTPNDPEKSWPTVRESELVLLHMIIPFVVLGRTQFLISLVVFSCKMWWLVIDPSCHLY